MAGKDAAAEVAALVSADARRTDVDNEIVELDANTVVFEALC